MSDTSSFVEVRSGYMDLAHKPREIKDLLRLLLKYHPEKLKFDTLVGTGLSGALVVPPLARALRKRYLVVRKPDDKSNHSSYPAEGDLGKRWLFVDDLIASGSTFHNCIDTVSKLTGDFFSHREHKTQLVGAFLYGGDLRSVTIEESETSYHGYRIKYPHITHEYRVRQADCTGCDNGCEGPGCKGPRCDGCWSWHCRCRKPAAPIPMPDRISLGNYSRYDVTWGARPIPLTDLFDLETT